MTVFLVYVAAVAVLFALGIRGIRWLHDHATWWFRPPQHVQARMLPAIRSHPEGSGVPQALGAAPRVVPGTVLALRSERKD